MVPTTGKRGKHVKAPKKEATEGETSNLTLKDALRELIKEVIKEELSPEKISGKFQNQDNKRKSFQTFSNQNTNHGNHQNPNKRKWNPPQDGNQKPKGGRCPRCGHNHEERMCPMVTGACFLCEAKGHLKSSCPKRGPPQQANQRTSMKCSKCGKQHEARDCPMTTGACYYCNEMGHLVAQCSTKAQRKNVLEMGGNGVVPGKTM